MGVNAREEHFEKLDLFGDTVLFTCARVDRGTVPDGLYAYDVRDDCDGNMCELAPFVFVNHWGTVISRKPIEMKSYGDGFGCGRPITEDEWGYLDEEISLDEWLAEAGSGEEACYALEHC